MAFRPWAFTYTPPKTVMPPPVETGAAAAAATPETTASTSLSRVAQLQARLEALQRTNAYLQQVLLARSGRIGVELDPAVDVEVARALEVVYGVTEPPALITIDMYNRLLDAEMAGLQIEMALPVNSPYEVNAFQTAAAAQATKFVEDKLIATGEFQNQLPVLLRGLKGDSVIFDTTKQELAKYPAAQGTDTAVARLDAAAGGGGGVIAARTLDISDPLSSYLNGVYDSFGSTYASMYKLAADVGHVEQELEEVVNTYFMQPIEDLIRIVSLFQAMRGLLHVPRLKTLVNGLTGFVFVRLQSEATGLRFFLDRFFNLAVSPLRTITGEVGQALNTIQAAAYQADRLLGAVEGTFTHTEGGLKGMSFAYDCGLPHNLGAPKPYFERKLGPAVASLASHLKWGLDTVEDKLAAVKEAFDKITQRRLLDRAHQLDLMCSMQALDSLQNVAKALISLRQKGTVTATTQSAQRVESVGRILASLDSGTGTQFAFQDGQVQVTPPEVPPVPDDVEPVLRAGGLDRVVPADFREIQGVSA